MFRALKLIKYANVRFSTFYSTLHTARKTILYIHVHVRIYDSSFKYVRKIVEVPFVTAAIPLAVLA